MPISYEKPTGERKLEFWLRMGQFHKWDFVGVPVTWDDDEIKAELEDWCRHQNANFGHSEKYTRYGFNDEKDFGSRT